MNRPMPDRRFVLAILPGSPSCAQEKPRRALELTVERIFDRHEFEAESRRCEWLHDGTRLHDVGGLQGVHRRPGPGRVTTPKPANEKSWSLPRTSSRPGESAPLAVDDYTLSDDRSRLLIFTNSKRVWRQNTRGDYWVLDRTSRELRKLGGDAPAPR